MSEVQNTDVEADVKPDVETDVKPDVKAGVKPDAKLPATPTNGRVVVAGAGLAGMVTALRLAEQGAKVTLVHFGIGGLQLGQGTVDILGYRPNDDARTAKVAKPIAELVEYVEAHPNHPYGLIKPEKIQESVNYLQKLVGRDLLVGDPTRNVSLPTAVGALRPTALYQPSMAAGVLPDLRVDKALSEGGEPESAGTQAADKLKENAYLILGVKQLKDFYPELIARNLERLVPGIRVRAAYLDLPARGNEADCSALYYARALDNADYRATFAQAIAQEARAGEIVGLPAMLGLDDLNAWRDIAARSGHEVFEIPLAPPSIPGMRLDRKLHRLLEEAGVRVIKGSKIIGVDADDKRIRQVFVGTAGRPTPIPATALVMAVGGFESGSIWLDAEGRVTEKVLNLPLVNVPDEPFHADYWGDPQPLFEAGVAVDETMRVLDRFGGDVVYENLYATGGLLAAGTRWQDKTGEGIALASAVVAADAIAASQTTNDATAGGVR